jgi:hypothetical protein
MVENGQLIKEARGLYNLKALSRVSPCYFRGKRTFVMFYFNGRMPALPSVLVDYYP